MRYPIRSGLVIPPSELGYATVPYERRKVTNHHWYWEKDRYHTARFRAVFRNLVTHVTPLLLEDHVELHERYSAPKQPSDVLMIDVVDEYLATNGVIHCVKEKSTCTVYQILPPEWASLKGDYRT